MSRSKSMPIRRGAPITIRAINYGEFPMGFYAVLNVVNRLLVTRQWQLHRCHRHGTESLHYFVTDANNRVLTPTYYSHRVGLTLVELLDWLEQSGDSVLIDNARALRSEN